jgi:hypothetical protein
LPDHDDKRLRHNSDRSSQTPEGPSPAAASPYTRSSSYVPEEKRRSSITLPGLAEITRRLPPATATVQQHSSRPYSVSSYPALHRSAAASLAHYQSQYSPTQRQVPMSEITTSPSESSHTVTAGPGGSLSTQSLALPPPVLASSSSSSIPSMYSTASSPRSTLVTSPALKSELKNLPLRNPATDGCGGCEEGGSCACVANFVNVDEAEEPTEGEEVLYTEIKG